MASADRRSLGHHDRRRPFIDKVRPRLPRRIWDLMPGRGRRPLRPIGIERHGLLLPGGGVIDVLLPALVEVIREPIRILRLFPLAPFVIGHRCDSYDPARRACTNAISSCSDSIRVGVAFGDTPAGAGAGIAITAASRCPRVTDGRSAPV